MQDINLLQELEQAQIEFEQNAVIREVEAILHQDLAAEQNISAPMEPEIDGSATEAPELPKGGEI